MPMKHTFTLIAASAFVVACGGPKEIAAPKPQCFFQDGAGPYTTQAPAWVCDETHPEIGLTAVSSYRQSTSGYDFMVEMATSRARQKLAGIISSKALGSAKDYRSTTGNSAANETVMASSELTQKTLTNVVLNGSRVLNKARNPATGQVYVLVGVSDKDLPEVANTAAKAAFMNDDAEFQRFKASQSFKELMSDLQN